MKSSLDSLQRLANLCPENFAHRVTLVEGALLRLQGSFRAARLRFQEAALQAQKGGWTNDVALAHEMAASCQNEVHAVRDSLRAARTAYTAWGARAKADQLTERIASLPL